MKCKYEGEGRYEGRCMGTKEIDPCPGYDKCSHFKPNFKTNADHIRSMSDDEELAKFLYFELLDEDGSMSCILDWLKRTYKEKEE